MNVIYIYIVYIYIYSYLYFSWDLVFRGVFLPRFAFRLKYSGLAFTGLSREAVARVLQRPAKNGGNRTAALDFARRDLASRSDSPRSSECQPRIHLVPVYHNTVDGRNPALPKKTWNDAIPTSPGFP